MLVETGGSDPAEARERTRRRRALLELVLVWGGAVTLVLANLFFDLFERLLVGLAGVERSVAEEWVALTTVVLLLFSIYAARRWSELEQLLEERIRTSRQLRKSRSQYHTLVNLVPGIVAVIRVEDGTVQWLNDRFEDHTGYPVDEWMDRDADEFFETVVPGAQDLLEGAAQGDRVGPLEVEARTVSGETRMFEAMATPFRDEAGEVTHVVGYGWDVTERARYADQLVASLEREKLIVDILGHDMKNSLAGCVTRLDALARQEAGIEGEVETIQESLQEMGDRLDDVIWYLRMRKEGLEFAPRNLGEIVRDGVRSARSAFPEEADRIALDVPGEAHWPVSPVIEHAVENLVKNALEWDEEGGPVEVSLETNGAARIAVADHGPGIDPDVASRMFERFEGGEADGGEDAPGLGLAIVDRVVDLHGGELQVEETPGGGTTFVVELPPEVPEATGRTPSSLGDGAAPSAPSPDSIPEPAGEAPEPGAKVPSPQAASDVEEIAEDAVQRVLDNREPSDPGDLADRIFHRWVDTGVHELRQALASVEARIGEAQRTGARWEEVAPEVRARLRACEAVLSTLFSEEEARKRLIRVDPEPVDLEERFDRLLSQVPYGAPPQSPDGDVPPAEADPDRLDDVILHLVRQLLERRTRDEPLEAEVTVDDGVVQGFVGLPETAVSRAELVEAVSLPFEVDSMALDLPYCRAVIDRLGGELFVTSRDDRVGFAFELPAAVEVPA